MTARPVLLGLVVLLGGCGSDLRLDPGVHEVVRCLPAPEVLDFGTVAVGSTVMRLMWVSNVTDQPTLVQLEADPPFSVVDPPLLIDAQTTVGLGVTFEPPDGREWVGEVRLQASRCPAVAVRVVGRGRSAPLLVSTHVLEFGPIAPGTQETRSLLVFSQSSVTVPFEIVGDYQTPGPVPGAAVSSFSAPVRGATLQPMQVLEIPFTFHAGDAGVRQAELTVRADAFDFTDVVRLRGVSGR